MYTSNICVIDKNSFVQSNVNVFRNNDASLLLGFRAKLALKFSASARLVKGLSNLNTLGNADSWRSNNIQLCIGYGL